jgi:lipoprotein-anchoring transpeptidase ErfK/SrfK
MRWLLTYRRLAAVGLIVAMLAALAALAPGSAAAGLGSAQRAQSVRDVQTRLAELRFMPTSQVDGQLGPRTKDAITAFQQWHGLTPDGVAGPRTLAKLSTAATPRPANQGPSRRIEVYRAKGITLLIDHDSVTRVIHSSAGKRGFETPAGSYRIVRKVLKDWSRPYRAWMPYTSYFHGGYALHEGSVPTYSASHGCVRLTDWDAADAYRFATVGTAVIVY